MKKLKLYHFSGLILFVLFVVNSGLIAYNYYFAGGLQSRFFADSLASFLCGFLLTKTLDNTSTIKKILFLLVPTLVIMWTIILSNIEGNSNFYNLFHFSIHNIGFIGSGILGIYLANQYKFSKNIKKLILPCLIWIFFVSVVSFKAIPEAHFSFLKQRTNVQLPNFELYNKDNRKVNFNNLKGKVVLVDFWGKGCKQCFMAFPYLEKIHKKYKNNPNFEMLIVNVWGKGEYKMGEWQENKFVKKHDLPYYHEEIKGISNIMQSEGIPQTFLFDKNGKLVFVHHGFSGDEQSVYVNNFSKEIDKLLK
jgi:thiol-disulfide isomerase/thioredoxin